VTEAYLDACCLIYLTEGEPTWRAAVEAQLRALPPATGLVTSRISRLECRSKPLRDGDLALLARHDAVFERVRLVEVTAAIVEQATELRAKYRFRSPDAIHVATAIHEGATVFLTGDVALARCTEISVTVLAP
jgi:predicted nucleic acid-binding protein